MGFDLINTANKTIHINTDNDPMFLIVWPTVGIIGFVLNLFCFMVFNSHEFKENIYAYLKLECVFIGLDLFITALRPFHHNNKSDFSRSFISQFYLVYLLIFFASVLEMSAFLCHITSTFDFYLLIINQQKAYKAIHKIPYPAKTFIIFAISFLLFTYQLFVFYVGSEDIVESASNQTIHSYKIYKLSVYDFGGTKAKTGIEIFSFLLRDGFNLAVLIVMNILIFKKVNESMERKKSILNLARNRTMTDISEMPTQNTNASTNTNINTEKNMKKTQIKTAVMVCMTCLNYVFGRLPILVVYIVRNFVQNDLTEWMNKIAVLCVYLSYAFCFPLYYYSNKRFQSVFHRHIRKALRLFKIIKS